MISCSIRTKRLNFVFKVNVNQKGMFVTTLPKEVVQKFEEAHLELHANQLGNKGYFECDHLEGLKQIVKNISEKYSERKVISQKIVIRYAIQTKCSYCKSSDGQIFPDGNWMQRALGDYNWQDGTKKLSSTDRDMFGFEIYVEPSLRVEYKFPDDSTQVEYESIPNDMIEMGSTLDWLNSLRSMGKEWHLNLKEIDYSEENGIFFKNIILYIINLNEKLKKFFGEDLDISKISNMKKIELLTLQ